MDKVIIANAIALYNDAMFEAEKNNPGQKADEEAVIRATIPELLKCGATEEQARAALDKVRHMTNRREEICCQLQEVLLEQHLVEKKESRFRQQLEQVDAFFAEYFGVGMREAGRIVAEHIAELPDAAEVMRGIEAKSQERMKEHKKEIQARFMKQLLRSVQDHADRLGVPRQYIRDLINHLQKFKGI